MRLFRAGETASETDHPRAGASRSVDADCARGLTFVVSLRRLMSLVLAAYGELRSPVVATDGELKSPMLEAKGKFKSPVLAPYRKLQSPILEAYGDLKSPVLAANEEFKSPVLVAYGKLNVRKCPVELKWLMKS